MTQELAAEIYDAIAASLEEMEIDSVDTEVHHGSEITTAQRLIMQALMKLKPFAHPDW